MHAGGSAVDNSPVSQSVEYERKVEFGMRILEVIELV